MGKWERYAKQRRAMKYYQAVRELVERFSPGKTLIDVGNGGTEVVKFGEFERRIAINIDPVELGDGVEVVVGRWPDVVPIESADVVTCCQVIEHLTDELIPPFVDQLFAVANTLIVTVPYKWPKGIEKYHKQDPIDEAKLDRLMGRMPDDLEVIADKKTRRMVALYRVR